MNLIVHLQEHAFQAMLISSIETFPTGYLPLEPGQTKPHKNTRHDGEATGLLFGQRLVKGEHLVFNVSLAVTMQATQRKAGKVIYSGIHFERIREITESFPYLEFLGGFHSHPWPKDSFGKAVTEPSPEDVETTIEAASKHGEELLEIILGITALSRNSYRDAKADGHSIDSYCGQYKYRLSAYCTEGAANKKCENRNLRPRESEWKTESRLLAVAQVICPLAAHGGAIFG